MVFGSRPAPKEPPASAASTTSSEALGEGEGGDDSTPGAEAAGHTTEPGESAGEVAPTPKGGHRAGTGRLGADAYEGAEHVACRHEVLAAGQRCPVCGQGTLYALPPGVEMRIDGHALLSALRSELHKLRCSACGQLFTAPLPSEAGEEKYSPRARADQRQVTGYATMVERTRELWEVGDTDVQIAETLSAEGFRSARRDHVLPRTVLRIRNHHQWGSRYHHHRLADKIDAMWTIHELGTRAATAVCRNVEAYQDQCDWSRPFPGACGHFDTEGDR
jgi:hypothetical protein